MYESYYGLRERPFSLRPDPRFLFLSPGHREALTNLQYGLRGNQGITLLLGEAGTGKTTLVRTALVSPEVTKSAACVYVSNPTLTRDEFYRFLSNGFGLGKGGSRSKTTFLTGLQHKAAKQRAAGVSTALILDESQSLPHDLFEEVRLLTNLDAGTDQLLTVILIGQPDLGERLNDPALKQLKQRISLRCNLRPLTLEETVRYISLRLRVAGGVPARAFTQDAVRMTYERSGGIPRTINVICDNALVTGLACRTRPVGRDIIAEVCRDFDLSCAEGCGEAGELLREIDPNPASGGNGTRPADTETQSVASAVTMNLPIDPTEAGFGGLGARGIDESS